MFISGCANTENVFYCLNASDVEHQCQWGGILHSKGVDLGEGGTAKEIVSRFQISREVGIFVKIVGVDCVVVNTDDRKPKNIYHRRSQDNQNVPALTI